MPVRPHRAAPAALAALALAAPLTVALAAPAAAATATVTHYVTTGEGGVPIYTNLFLPPEATDATPVPLVMRTHGWGGHGARDLAEASTTTHALLEAGYAVVTWDQRGFGWSGGEVHIDKPELEGRDASAVLTETLAQTGAIAMEAPDDPLVGMSGISYAGGIQPATALFDERIDALAPEIAWSDLRYSLYENEVINIGWGSLLYSAGTAAAQGDGLDAPTPPGPQTGGLDQAIHELFTNGVATNQFTVEGQEYLAESSLRPVSPEREPQLEGYYGDEAPLDLPTLVMNGSVDTLFDVRDGYGLYEAARAAGQDARFIVFCGGHQAQPSSDFSSVAACPGSYTDAGDRAHLDAATVTWMDRYLKGEDVDTGPPVEYRTNADTSFRGAAAWPPRRSSVVTVSGSGPVVNPAATGTPSLDPSNFATAAQPTPAGDPRTLTFEAFSAPADAPVDVVGFGEARLRVSGTGPAVHLFVKLVHREAGEVLNLQENAVRVEGLSSEPQDVTVPLTGFAYTLPAGHHLDVQVSTESEMHLPARLQAQATVEAAVDVPVLPARPIAQARSTEAACPPGTVPDAGYPDVPEGDVHDLAIDCVTWWEVAEGFGDGTYRPGTGVTRAQMASFVARLLREAGAELPAGSDAFPDDEGSFHEASIDALAAAGVVEGRDGQYFPEETVRRSQMATYLVRAQTLLDGTAPPQGRDYFTDDETSVHEENINRAAGLGLTGGVTGDTFEPTETLTRAQMASFLARELDVAVRYGFATPPSSP